MTTSFKVVHLTSAHSALDGRIFRKECRTLSRSGFETVLIAVHDASTTVDGVRIHAIPRALNRLQRMTLTVLRVFKAALEERADLYHFHDPELLIVGMLLRAMGKRVVYDTHEDVPRDILTKGYLPKPIRHFVAACLSALEALGAAIFSGVVAATPTIARRFPARKTLLLQNFPETEISLPQRELQPTKQLGLFIYAGIISAERGIGEMVQALGIAGSDAHMHLAGSFHPPELEAQMRQLRSWSQVSFHGWLQHQDLLQLMNEASAGLVVLWPSPNYTESQPTKLFEYMLLGLPVIASDFPRWKEIVGGNACGLLVDPCKPDEIAAAMRWLIEHPEDAKLMGMRGRQAVIDQYSWESEGRKLTTFYQMLLAPQAR